MNRPQASGRGFTLIELMIIVAVVSVLMLIVVPKFGQMIRRANEAGSKGHLGSARSAIRLYYMDNEQHFPTSFSLLQQPGVKYLTNNISLYTGEHPVTNVVDDVPSFDPASDAAHWGYVNGPADDNLGYFWIQCGHPDSTGRIWSSY